MTSRTAVEPSGWRNSSLRTVAILPSYTVFESIRSTIALPIPALSRPHHGRRGQRAPRREGRREEQRILGENPAHRPRRQAASLIFVQLHRLDLDVVAVVADAVKGVEDARHVDRLPRPRSAIRRAGSPARAP